MFVLWFTNLLKGARGRARAARPWAIGAPVLWIAGPGCPAGRVAVETAREHPAFEGAAYVSVPYRPSTAAGIRLDIEGWDGPMVHRPRL